MPVLFYGLEACALNKCNVSSFEFASNRFLRNYSKLINCKLLRLFKKNWFSIP